MRYADTSRGRPFAKDPAVVRFRGRYLLYYSLPPYPARQPSQAWQAGWAMGIAESADLDAWRKIGEITPTTELEARGLCAPGAIVVDGAVHLFYQTYGNGAKDAICHAVSDDGITFRRDPTNPIFAPTGVWTCGRAIDADVIAHQDRLLLYFATRDPTMTVQLLGVAGAPLASTFERGTWTQLCAGPILAPELPWEQQCIEAPALCAHDGMLFMAYGGAYNNQPQQIGCASSSDGLSWQRISDHPLLPNGRAGEWNSSESGHPFLFTDAGGETHLFFQGNCDHGQSWYLSRRRIAWQHGLPCLLEEPLR